MSNKNNMLKKHKAPKKVFDVCTISSPLDESWNRIDKIKFQALYRELESGCGAVTFDGSNILDETKENMNKKILAFGRCLGKVKIRGKSSSPVWQIKVRQADGGPKSYSESSDMAPFHTDASYYPYPMKYLLFFVVRPAQTGGENQVFNMFKRLPEFAKTIKGRKYINVLKNEVFPFSMSPTFHTKSVGKATPLECGSVLSKDGMVRFQIKALREGFRRRPDLASDIKIDAVEELNTFIQRSLDDQGVRLRRGQILIINNWRVLHSRKPFDDPKRLLLRLSISNELPVTCQGVV